MKRPTGVTPAGRFSYPLSLPTDRVGEKLAAPALYHPSVKLKKLVGPRTPRYL